MAYFPAHCDYDCKECSQNIWGWCEFRDISVMTIVELTEPYNYSTTFTNEKTNKEDKK